MVAAYSTTGPEMGVSLGCCRPLAVQPSPKQNCSCILQLPSHTGKDHFFILPVLHTMGRGTIMLAGWNQHCPLWLLHCNASGRGKGQEKGQCWNKQMVDMVAILLKQTAQPPPHSPPQFSRSSCHAHGACATLPTAVLWGVGSTSPKSALISPHCTLQVFWM